VSSVLLEDKQKFKHGGVWSLSYLHRISWVFRIHSCRLICINLQFMYIFSDYTRFWFVWVLLVELYDSIQVIGERVTLRAMWIKEDSKGGPKWPNIGKIRGPNRSTKRAQNAAEPERADRTGQCPPRADRGPTTARGGKRMAVRPAQCFLRVSSVFARLFIFWSFLLVFAL